MSSFVKLQPYDIIEVGWNEELRIVCDDEVEQFDGIVHPNCDLEFEEDHITRVWRLFDDDYLCIYRRVKDA